MPIQIDPKVDFAFKLVFGSPEHTQITIHFLNSVLSLPRPIREVEILNPIQGRDRSEDKLIVLDVLAKDADGRLFNIEMQMTLPIDLPQRLTYYNCLNYVRQIGKGEAYYELRPAISICVLSRPLFPHVEPCHLSFRLRCDQEPLVFSNALEIHTLELSKYAPASDNIGELPPLEKWLYFLRYAEHMDAAELKIQLADAEFAEAVGVLEMISHSPEDRQFYEARQKFLHDEQARLLAARKEGREEGRTEGALAGQVQLLQGQVGDPESSLVDLCRLPTSELTRMLSDLQERLRTRPS